MAKLILTDSSYFISQNRSFSLIKLISRITRCSLCITLHILHLKQIVSTTIATIIIINIPTSHFQMINSIIASTQLNQISFQPHISMTFSLCLLHRKLMYLFLYSLNMLFLYLARIVVVIRVKMLYLSRLW